MHRNVMMEILLMGMDVTEIALFKMDGTVQEGLQCQKAYVIKVRHQKLFYR